MIAIERVLIRHEHEAHLLGMALEGNAQAVNEVIQHFCSKDPMQHQAMQQTMHDLMDANVCLHLVGCLGTQCWDKHRDCERRVDPHDSECIDEAIIAVIVEDEYEWETAIKDSVLRQALKHEDIFIRHAAVFLLALRGDVEVIPALEAAIDEGKAVWKLRAIRGLAALDNVRCAPPLIKAICLDRDIFQKAAQDALHKLGAKAETAWQSGLNHTNRHVRWQVASALGKMGDPRGVELLAEGLFDEDSNVRWGSVEVITHLGEQTIPAILKALSCRLNLETGRQAVFQALKGAAFHKPEQQKYLKPILDCLHMPDTSREAPQIARQLLLG